MPFHRQYERLEGGNVPSRGADTVAFTAASGYQQQQQQAGYALVTNTVPTEGATVSHAPSAVHLVHVSDQRSRWSHINDLDAFFVRVYQYHQQHGFVCIVLRQTLELCQFLFVIVFSLFLYTCVDYDRLFNRAGAAVVKVSLSDVLLLSSGQCMTGSLAGRWLLVLLLLVTAVFWLLRLARVCYSCCQCWQMRCFYGQVLRIADCELDNMSWQSVQSRLILAQRQHSLCVHKPELTELDIHNRILRFKNYMVAMVNKQVLPLKFSVPLVGDVFYLSRGLRYNLELLLFWGPGSAFENKWHLAADYKRLSERDALAAVMARRTLVLGLLNLTLCPVILLWQLLYMFYNYAEMIKREPGVLGARRWSSYARLFLRHFNELDHELGARLSRGYRAAAKYTSSFTSPPLEIIAKNVMFVAGALLAVLLALAVYDEDLLTVEHALTAITLLGATVAICRAFIADENLVFAPEQLLSSVLAHIHYMPLHWRGAAHTSQTVAEFGALFQLKVYYLLEEALSPIVTPLILIWRIRPVAQQLVDFYRNFTVEVVGVGDVCSFAQLDVRRHGDPEWRIPASETASVTSDHHNDDGNEGGAVRTTTACGPAPSSGPAPFSGPAHFAGAEVSVPADYGKTELSLMHFTINNPGWIPASPAGQYITEMRNYGVRESSSRVRQCSLHYHQQQQQQQEGAVGERRWPAAAELPLVNSLYNSGSLQASSLLASLQEFPAVLAQASDPFSSALHQQNADRQMSARVAPSIAELTAAEMAASAIYLQELRHRRVHLRRAMAGLANVRRVSGSHGNAQSDDVTLPAAVSSVQLPAAPSARQSQQQLHDTEHHILL